MIDKSKLNKSFSLGAYNLVKNKYAHLELQNILGVLKTRGFPLDKLVKGMLTFKTSHNLSIHKCSEWMNQQHMLNQFNLDSFNEKTLYRSLETLGQNYDLILLRIKENIFSKYSFEHTDINIDWSSLVLHGNASPLGKRGYSRDHRPDKKQITFGVSELRNPINIPIGITIRKGNVVDKTHFEHSFLSVVKHLADESLIVIDRGANTKDNKELIREKKMHYLTARILSGKDNPILSDFSQNTAKKIEIKNKEPVFCKKLKRDEEYLYICFSNQLYEQQITAREKKIERKLQEIKDIQSKIRQGKKIKFKTTHLNKQILIQKVTLQEKLIHQNDEQLRKHIKNQIVSGREGFYILESSKNLTEEEALRIYKEKDSIEKTMNSLKNEIEIKPVRVWTESSIKGALIIGFLAQLFISLLRFEYKKLKSLSTKTILESLKSLTLTIKNTGMGLIEQIISNIDWICQEILPDLLKDTG